MDKTRDKTEQSAQAVLDASRELEARIEGGVGPRGSKTYAPDDIEAARDILNGRDKEAGRVLTEEEADRYVRRLTGGGLTARELRPSPCAYLGDIPFYYERDVWNDLRSRRRDVLTIAIVHAAIRHQFAGGWVA